MTPQTGAHRLAHPSGTTGLLVPRGPWSLEVRELAGPDPADWLAEARAEAARHDVLDLRSAAPLPGSTPVAAGEHVVAVPLALADAAATRALGRRVAGSLRRGDLLVLSGPLGAGKTTFVQGLAEGLGVCGRVTSPTFVLARAHRGPLPLLHVDAYRLMDTTGALDLDDLDLDAALEDAVTAVEWGEGLVEALAEAHLGVALGRPGGSTDGSSTTGGHAADRRTAEIRPAGARWAVLTGTAVSGR